MTTIKSLETVQVMTYTYTVEYCEEDGIFVARVAEFPSLAAHGSTRSEALDEIVNVVEQALADMDQPVSNLEKFLNENDLFLATGHRDNSARYTVCDRGSFGYTRLYGQASYGNLAEGHTINGQLSEIVPASVVECLSIIDIPYSGLLTVILHSINGSATILLPPYQVLAATALDKNDWRNWMRS